MKKYFPLPTVVTGFVVTENCIDCICGSRIMKIDKYEGTILLEKELFEKQGYSREMILSNKQLIIYDFCTLYILNQEDYEVINEFHLGNDLTSDICGIEVDEHKIYTSIRNGSIYVIHRDDNTLEQFSIFEHSMWAIRSNKNKLIAGSVDGQLLELNQDSMEVQSSLTLSNKNIRDLLFDQDLVYAACQNKSLYIVNYQQNILIRQVKNLHMKMFDIVGIDGDTIITISHPCSEIKVWTKDNFELIEKYILPLSLSGKTYLDNNKIYISSRNIKGLGIVHL